MTRRIVVSAVNISEMGPLSVLRDALRYLSIHHSRSFDIIALVHRKALFQGSGITYLEFPDAKSSWLRRLYYEFVAFERLSRKLSPYLWFSLHDITPNVRAERRAVYCHNPSPFYPLSLRECLLSPGFAVYARLYSELYRLNIKKNDFVIVQQQWLRSEFERRYGINNVVVAHPDVSIPVQQHPLDDSRSDKTFRFFYPCFPRAFKNVETTLQAARALEGRGETGFEVSFTFDGTENSYARELVSQSSDLKCVRFLGTASREKVFEQYARADCLIFASKLETWGLPITEFKQFDKPMLIADLPYAHETVGGYSKAVFFAHRDAAALANLMSAAMRGRLTFSQVEERRIRAPFARDWNELFGILLGSLAPASESSATRES